MPAATLYPPAPLVAREDPSKAAKALPSILAAIAPTKPDGSERTEKERAAAVRQVAEGWFKANRPWFLQAIKCREMVAGNQWGFLDERLGSWIAQPEFTDDKTRETKNKLAPAIQQMVAMLTRDTPQLKVTAAKTDIADSAASEFATKVSTHIQIQTRFAETFRALAEEVSKVGDTWLLTQWRKDRGPFGKTGFTLVSDAQFDEMGRVTADPVFEDKLGLQGDVDFQVVPGEMVATEPGTKRAGGIDGLAICMRETLTTGALRDRFPKKWQEIQTAGASSLDADEAMLNRADRSSVIAAGNPFAEGADDSHQQATVYTFWGRATEGYPNGWMICVAGDVVCAWEERNERYGLPTEAPDLPPRVPFPLMQAVADPHATSSRGRSRVLDAIPHQQEINELASKQIDHYALTSNTKVRMPAGLSCEWTDGIGQVIRVPRFHEGAQIGYLQPPPVPDYQSPIRAADADLKEALGINDASNGEVPFSNTSGRAMDKAQQKDETRLNPIKTSLFNLCAEAIRFALQLYRRYATYERMMLVAGDGEDTDFEFFTGAQLVSVIDVVAFNDQMLPVDPTARHLAIANVVQTLASIPADQPKTRQEIARLYHLQNDGAFLDEINPHVVKAEDNNRDLMANEPVEFAEWDDHLVHKDAIERLMCSKAWRARVKKEKADPQYATADPTTGAPVPGSPLEQATMALWQQHTASYQAQNAPPAMPGMGAPAGVAPVLPGPGAQTAPQGVAA